MRPVRWSRRGSGKFAWWESTEGHEIVPNLVQQIPTEIITYELTHRGKAVATDIPSPAAAKRAAADVQ